MTRPVGRVVAWTVVAVISCGAATAHAQLSQGPDVTYTGINGILSYGAVGDVAGFILGSHTCNIGNQNLLWANSGTPGLAMNAYRLHDGRLLQIGLSFVKTACCAAAVNGCGLGCNGAGGNVLGAGCRDTYTASWNGGQSRLAPRSSINAFTGQFFGFSNASGNAIWKRLQIKMPDLVTTSFPGALYFVEGLYAAIDDAAAGNSMNNASYALANVTGASSMSEGGFFALHTPAIYAWRDHGNGLNNPDNSVSIQNVDVPGEGRFIIGSKVTPLGGGQWRYDYAVYNFNSDRSGGSFSVPVSGATVTGIGFNDVDYHSGEVYDNTNWVNSNDGDTITWRSPQTHAQNANSNALRWGTLYNFWFTANRPPENGPVNLGLFKPGAVPSVSANVPVPTPACAPPQFAAGAAGVSFDERAFDGFIDPAAESTDGVNVNLGRRTFNIEFTTALENLDGTPLSASAFTVSDSAGPSPLVDHIETDDGRLVTVVLTRHIDVQQRTTIGVHARSRCDANMVLQGSITVGYLPGDVDQSRIVDPLDLLKVKQYVNGLASPAIGTVDDYMDINRDGEVNPVDVLSFKRLVNGISPSTRVWNGQALP